MRDRIASAAKAARTPHGRRGWWLGGTATLVAAAAAAWAMRDVPAALGRLPEGGRADRVRRSPQFDADAGAFRNPVPSSVVVPGTARKVLRDMLVDGRKRRPAGPVPMGLPTPDGYRTGATGCLHVVWYGHASTLVEFDAGRVLFDPVFSERCSPSTLLGPRRLHPVPVTVRRLPVVSAIVISHDHYDHLDTPTVRELVRTQTAPFVVPLGIGSHLQRWGVPHSRIVELDWEESTRVSGLRLTATPARHFSGRGLARDRTLWSSWVVSDGNRRAFYAGDSGYFDGYATIGAQHGPFDVTLMPIGAYNAAWPDIHLNPEEAVAAHMDVRGELMIPVHWATFALAPHAWREPADRLWREAKARGVRIAVPRPGDRINIDDPPTVDGWWQQIA